LYYILMWAVSITVALQQCVKLLWSERQSKRLNKVLHRGYFRAPICIGPALSDFSG